MIVNEYLLGPVVQVNWSYLNETLFDDCWGINDNPRSHEKVDKLKKMGWNFVYAVRFRNEGWVAKTESGCFLNKKNGTFDLLGMPSGRKEGWWEEYIFETPGQAEAEYWKYFHTFLKDLKKHPHFDKMTLFEV